MKGMTTCKVCGRDFPLLAEEHYVGRGIEKKSVIAAFSVQEEAIQYDVFDCPHCGRQNVMQERKRGVCPCDFGICDECEEDEEEDEDHSEPDGCVGCKYETYSTDEEPCSKCKNCYMNRFEREDDDDE